MGMIKGITIALLERNQVGIDGFNRPIYEYKKKCIHNVLISPATSNDVVSSLDLTGKRAEYVLAIPKKDCNNWEDRIVEFFGRRWKTIGFPIEGIEANIPLDWNKKVMVELYE